MLGTTGPKSSLTSASALTVWARWFFTVAGRGAALEMFSSISGFHTLGARSTHPPPVVTTRNVSGHRQRSPLGTKSPLRPTGLDEGTDLTDRHGPGATASGDSLLNGLLKRVSRLCRAKRALLACSTKPTAPALMPGPRVPWSTPAARNSRSEGTKETKYKAQSSDREEGKHSSPTPPRPVTPGSSCFPPEPRREGSRGHPFN